MSRHDCHLAVFKSIDFIIFILVKSVMIFFLGFLKLANNKHHQEIIQILLRITNEIIFLLLFKNYFK